MITQRRQYRYYRTKTVRVSQKRTYRKTLAFIDMLEKDNKLFFGEDFELAQFSIYRKDTALKIYQKHHNFIESANERLALLHSRVNILSWRSLKYDTEFAEKHTQRLQSFVKNINKARYGQYPLPPVLSIGSFHLFHTIFRYLFPGDTVVKLSEIENLLLFLELLHGNLLEDKVYVEARKVIDYSMGILREMREEKKSERVLTEDFQSNYKRLNFMLRGSIEKALESALLVLYSEKRYFYNFQAYIKTFFNIDQKENLKELESLFFPVFSNIKVFRERNFLQIFKNKIALKRSVYNSQQEEVKEVSKKKKRKLKASEFLSLSALFLFAFSYIFLLTTVGEAEKENTHLFLCVSSRKKVQRQKHAVPFKIYRRPKREKEQVRKKTPNNIPFFIEKTQEVKKNFEREQYKKNLDGLFQKMVKLEKDYEKHLALTLHKLSLRKAPPIQKFWRNIHIFLEESQKAISLIDKGLDGNIFYPTQSSEYFLMRNDLLRKRKIWTRVYALLIVSKRGFLVSVSLQQIQSIKKNIEWLRIQENKYVLEQNKEKQFKRKRIIEEAKRDYLLSLRCLQADLNIFEKPYLRFPQIIHSKKINSEQVAAFELYKKFIYRQLRLN